jgi:hypothetical protein
MNAVARALNALRLLLPLDPGVENSLDKRLLALADNGTVAQNVELGRALALFLHCRTQERVSAARPYVPTLLKLLGEEMATTGAHSYYSLMIVAESAPQYFEHYGDTLVQLLDNPGFSAKTFSMRIIAVLASSHPEYVAGARETLHSLSENGAQELLRAEAAKAYKALRNVPRVEPDRKSTMLRDPAIASLYEVPVWQRAVEGHLTAAYSDTVLPVARRRSRRSIKREVLPSKRCDLYQEFVGKLKVEEQVKSFEDQIALMAPEATAQAEVQEVAPVEPVLASPPATAEAPLPAIEMPIVVMQPSRDGVPELTGAVGLQEMMDEVQIEFSSQAGNLLDALGMGHLKRGCGPNGEEVNRKISGKELVSALEKLVKQHNGKAM